MDQPNGNIKFFDSQAKVSNKDTYNLFPVVWDNAKRLPPLQLFKDYDGLKPTTFELLSCDGTTTTDLFDSIDDLYLVSRESETGQFDCLYYLSDNNFELALEVDSGYWQVHLAHDDWDNDWYSLFIKYE